MTSVNIDQLPSFSKEYELTKEQIDNYREKGHMFLQQVASLNELNQYRPIINEIVQKLNKHTKPVNERDTYGKAFIQVLNLWTHHEAMRRFAMARRFSKLAADLMGVDAVRVYIDQALFKEPGGGHTPWHQDQIYWPLDTYNTITMWMPLVPISEEVGSMTFASGTNKSGYINKTVISDESHATLKQYIEGTGIETVNYGAMAAGDVTFHAGWTVHSAPGNPTNTMREVMTVVYFADGTKVAEPDSNARRNNLEQFLPGLKQGDLAASHMNPLAFKR